MFGKPPVVLIFSYDLHYVSLFEAKILSIILEDKTVIIDIRVATYQSL